MAMTARNATADRKITERLAGKRIYGELWFTCEKSYDLKFIYNR